MPFGQAVAPNVGLNRRKVGKLGFNKSWNQLLKKGRRIKQMMLQAIQSKFNRGRMGIEEIEWLIKTAEKQQNELTVAHEQELSYIDDIEQMEGMLEQANQRIQDLETTIKQHQAQESFLLERIKKQSREIREMWNDRRLIRFWELAEENLKLAQELAELKGELSG